MTFIQPIDFHRPPGTPAARAYELDRTADAALAAGQVNQAERLSHRAAELRATCRMPEQLAVHDERRLRLGLKHVVELGDRALGYFIVQVVQERRDIAGVLDLLDEWRAALTPAMVRGVGGDRFPGRELRAVPR